MDRSSKIYLIKENISFDRYGIPQKTTEEKKVFAQVQSVTLSEWSEGGRAGLNPELRFIILDAEYSGEEVIRYKQQTYSVYRVYHAKNDLLELYTEKRKGTSGA